MNKALLFLFAVLLALTQAAKSVDDAPLKLIQSVDLPNYSGDFDHFAVDLGGKRLFLAAEDHGTVEVFNLNSGTKMRTIEGFEAPHSFLFMPEADRLLVTDSGKGLSKILDANNFKVITTVQITPGADSIGFDRATHQLYIVTGGKDVQMNHSFLSIVNPVNGKHLGDIPFDANHVEAMAIEQNGQRLFINITDRNHVAVIDKNKRRIIDRWPVNECQQNSPIALDEPNHRLFVVCRKPGMLVVFDTSTGKSIAGLPAPERADDVVFDGQRHRVYVTGGEGYIGVYQQKDPDHYELISKVPSAVGAKTALLVPQLNRLYVAVSPGEGKVGAKVLTFEIE